MSSPVKPSGTETRSKPSLAPPSPSAPAARAAFPGSSRPHGGTGKLAPSLKSGGQSRGVRDYLYIVLLLALVPLAISTFQSRVSVEEELIATVKEHPEIIPQLKSLPEKADIFDVLPEHRLRDAFLPRDSKLHWLFGILAAGIFFAIVATAFPTAMVQRLPLLGIGLLTATVGVLLLLGVQLAAKSTAGQIYIGFGLRAVIFYIIKFIGFSYQCADDPRNGFLLSFFGYTMGVGLCEELCKCLPLFFRIKHFATERRAPANNWRSICLWGMASGMGFGIAEGIMYSGNTYNGVSPASIYAVRFLSCVALHSIWAGSVGITMFNRQQSIDAADKWYSMLFELVLTISIAMTLHGLYDTLLKKDMDALALVAAVVSFGWFAFQIETMRRSDPIATSTRAAAMPT
ncbi:MAG TPA: PrsW family glutamic-type intramembrane protease [Pirellulales bacterium]|nr:PrsW family glutamic-type intramembrane protease [Pirellulales bacterium]